MKPVAECPVYIGAKKIGTVTLTVTDANHIYVETLLSGDDMCLVIRGNQYYVNAHLNRGEDFNFHVLDKIPNGLYIRPKRRSYNWRPTPVLLDATAKALENTVNIWAADHPYTIEEAEKEYLSGAMEERYIELDKLITKRNTLEAEIERLRKGEHLPFYPEH